MNRPRYAEAALADLRDILDYIAQDNPLRARTFVAEIRERCRGRARQPRLYPLRQEFGEGIRLAVHGQDLILFGEQRGDVVIERVIHGARDRGILLP